MATNKRPFTGDWEDCVVDHCGIPLKRRAISAVADSSVFPLADLDYVSFSAEGNTGIAFQISPAYSNSTESGVNPLSPSTQISTPLDAASLVNHFPKREVNDSGVRNNGTRRLCFGMVRIEQMFPIWAEAKRYISTDCGCRIGIVSENDQNQRLRGRKKRKRKVAVTLPI